MTERPILNASSLLDLKAELLRKKEALKEAKLKRGLYSDFTGTKLKKSDKEPKSNKKQKQLSVNQTSELSEQEEQALKKSRSMLERKAALYDKLSRGLIVPDDDQSERFLVNFDKKASDGIQQTDGAIPQDVDNIPLPSNTWVKHDTALKVEGFPVTEPNNDPSTLEDEENIGKGPVHYQNVRFKEVRNHGVGYFSFSTDEEERRKQMEALNALRHQTEDQQNLLLKKKRRQQASLRVRLAQIRRRRNMPVEDDDEEDEILEEEESEDEEKELEDVLSEPAQIETTDETKPIRMRPWDKGKDFSDLLPEKRPSQSSVANQWVENRRAERLADFAPPQSYGSTKRPSQKNSDFWTQSHQADTFSAQVDSHTSESVTESEAAEIIGEKLSFIKKQF